MLLASGFYDGGGTNGPCCRRAAATTYKPAAYLVVTSCLSRRATARISTNSVDTQVNWNMQGCESAKCAAQAEPQIREPR
jgi:hypothetical protein